jgi:outer membrane protein OmpA-like peptidoglycan-associated protein
MKTIKAILMIIGVALIFSANSPVSAQDRVNPVWWFGVSGGANFNFYRGTAYILNNNLTADYAFDNGFGVAPYASIFTEYRPNPVWGLILNVAYDGHRGIFDRSDAPAGYSTSLNAEFDYLAFEPSLRIAPFASNFYLFIGPRLSYNIKQSFVYQTASEPDQESEWNNVYGVRFSAQIGAGYDIPLSRPENTTQVDLSPFISFIPYFGDEPRSIENLTLTTVRAGIALKFGCVKRTMPAQSSEVTPPPADVQFSVIQPNPIPGQQVVTETLPLSNYIFFDAGNSEIPKRYILLTADQANNFTEAQLQDCQKTSGTRSERQLRMYYNVLNIVADRMKRYPNATIKLIGASGGKGERRGKEYAVAVKDYFVNVFGIDGSRITVEGRSLPLIPSEEFANGVVDTSLTRAEDNRVDIISRSPDLMTETEDNSALCLKPIVVTALNGGSPVDQRVTINAKGAGKALNSWSVAVTDRTGNTQYFGPYTADTASISAEALLKDNQSENYTIVLTGKTKSGDTLKRESSFALSREIEPVQHEQLTSILFEFDKSKTVETYKNFLVNNVAPLISSNTTVVITGHTDIVGGAEYNLNLSVERAREAQSILDSVLTKEGKTGIVYKTNGFGADNPPFSNSLPEQRFYNRTVVIDMIPSRVASSH